MVAEPAAHMGSAWLRCDTHVSYECLFSIEWVRSKRSAGFDQIKEVQVLLCHLRAVRP